MGKQRFVAHWVYLRGVRFQASLRLGATLEHFQPDKQLEALWEVSHYVQETCFFHWYNCAGTQISTWLLQPFYLKGIPNQSSNKFFVVDVHHHDSSILWKGHSKLKHALAFNAVPVCC